MAWVRVVTEEDVDRAPGSPGEVSPYNSKAVRGRDGIWNRDALPVTEWEDPHQRVVMPVVLRESLTLPVPDVLRWDREKYRSVTSKHTRDLPVISDLGRHLANWRYHGEEVGEHAGNQRILFQDAGGRWYAVSVGPLAGSDNVITVVGGSDPRFLDNRLREMANVVKRGT